MHVTVREWTDILARIRFGTRRVAGKSYSAARIKLVAHRLASYADSDGTRVRPGIARLALDLEMDYRAARDILALLRGIGLVQLVRVRAGGGRADEYRLALPFDLLERDDLEMWSPGRYTVELERIREINSGGRRHRPAGHTQGIEGPARTADSDPAAQGPEGPASDIRAGASGTAEIGDARP